MAEERMFNATLKSKGLDAYVPEDGAQEMCKRIGTRRIAIIEFHSAESREYENGSFRAFNAIDSFELIPAAHEDRFRTAIRVLWENRSSENGQPTLPLSKDAVADQAATLGAAAAEVEEWDGNTEKPDGKVVEFSGTAKKTTAAKKTAARK